MTEFAAVSGQTAVTQGSGAKGAGKAQGTGAVLDGAFAAIFGKAADGTAVGADGQAVAAPGTVDPALVGIDPALLEGEGTGADGIDPLAGKPRKPGSRNKTAPDQTETPALLVPAAPAALPAPEAHAADGKAKAAPDVDALAALTAGQDAAARTQDESAETLKALAADGKAIADILAQAKDAKAAPAPATAKADAQPATANANLAAQLADQSSTDGSGTGENRGNGQDRMAALAAVTDAANDDSALSGGFDPLRDIMQSLPPVVQSQIGVARGGAAPAASTGELLGDKVIDMGVSGQWIDRMAREIASIADGTGHSRFQLSPPNLGRVQVDLWRGGDAMNVRLTAETDEAARRLREGQSALENHARIGALSLGSISVEKASAPFDSGREQGQRQNADANANAQQQASAQAQGQSAQGRGNSGSGPNRGGTSAVIGSERDGDTEQAARTTRASDPRVRFA